MALSVLSSDTKMSVCEIFEQCAFVRKYEVDPDWMFAVKGFVVTYCEGEKQALCVRKRITKLLGSEKIPVNMMPNGMAFIGTSKKEWSEEIKSLAKSLSVLTDI